MHKYPCFKWTSQFFFFFVFAYSLWNFCSVSLEWNFFRFTLDMGWLSTLYLFNLLQISLLIIVFPLFLFLLLFDNSTVGKEGI